MGIEDLLQGFINSEVQELVSNGKIPKYLICAIQTKGSRGYAIIDLQEHSLIKMDDVDSLVTELNCLRPSGANFLISPSYLGETGGSNYNLCPFNELEKNHLKKKLNYSERLF